MVILLEVWSRDKNYDFANTGPMTTPQADIYLRSRPGPYDHYRVHEDTATINGLTLNIEESIKHGIPQETINEWFGGIEIKFTNNIRPETFDVDNYNSVKNNAERAGQELDRIVESKKAYYLPFDTIPHDLSIAPGSLVVRPDRLRYVTDWSNSDVNLNQSCSEESVDYKSLNDMIEHFRQNGYWFGLDLKDCFSHWPLSPSCRRLFGFKNHASGEIGCFLFLPQGLSPSPGHNDRQIKQCIMAARRFAPKVLLFDFVDDIRGTIEGSDATDYNFVLQAMNTTVRVWNAIGLDLHGPSQPKKFILPTRMIDWIGFTLCTIAARIFLQDEKYVKIIAKIGEFQLMIKDKELPHVRAVSQITGLLNWSLAVVQKAHVHLRPFYREIVKPGALPLWQNGYKNANPKIKSIDGFDDELTWWLQKMKENPFLQISTTNNGDPYVWTPQFLRKNRHLILQLADEVQILTTDASELGWGATISNTSYQGAWGLDISRQSSNYRELRTVLEWMTLHGHLHTNNIILLRTDNMTTIHYVNKGSGRYPDLSAIGERITNLSTDLNITIIAEHIKGKHNTAADSLSRFMDTAGPPDPFPDRCLTAWAWKAIQNRFRTTIQMEAFTDPHGDNSRATFRCWENQSIFQTDISIWRNIQSWWFPPANLRHATLRFIADAVKDEQFTEHEKKKVMIFLPVKAMNQLFFGQNKFSQIYKFKRNLQLFHYSSPHGELMPDTDEKWAVYTPK